MRWPWKRTGASQSGLDLTKVVNDQLVEIKALRARLAKAAAIYKQQEKLIIKLSASVRDLKAENRIACAVADGSFREQKSSRY